MVISNLELTDLIDEEVYHLLSREPLLERRILGAAWDDVSYDRLLLKVESGRPEEQEDADLSQRELTDLVSAFAEQFVLRLKADRLS